MASRVVTRHYDEALAPVGLSTSAYAILSRTGSEGPLPLGELAARLAMDRSTLSREVAPLIDDGLVSVSAADGDRRKKILSLTDAGTELVAAARPLWARAQKSLSAEYGATRTEELIAELHALVGAA